MKQNQKILVVDDEQDLLEILKFNLETEGYEVQTATSAEEAQTLDIASFDLLLLDVMMGGMSGFALARLLKDDPQTVRVPIIFLTARDTENDTVTGFNLGADDYMTKPFLPLELVARCCEGGPLTEREKSRIPAQREPFAACYTALERQLKRTGAESAPELPLLRLLAAESGGSDGFLRAAMALRVFRERGLVQITEGEDGFLTLRLSRPAGKVDLFACPYLRRLKSPNPNGRE